MAFIKATQGKLEFTINTELIISMQPYSDEEPDNFVVVMANGFHCNITKAQYEQIVAAANANINLHNYK